jgi:hypothetical protein
MLMLYMPSYQFHAGLRTHRMQNNFPKSGLPAESKFGALHPMNQWADKKKNYQCGNSAASIQGHEK